jgi:hypothetical protein
MRALHLIGAALALGLAARPADAGVVVYENGNVVQGRIDPGEITPDAVTVHSPRIAPGGATLPGKVVIPRGEIRWFDAAGDGLTSTYLEKFRNEPLDPKWVRVLMPPAEEEGPIGPLDVRRFLKDDGLTPTRFTRSWPEGDLSLRAPTAAAFHDTGRIAGFVLGSGARVHVFSALAPEAAPSTQLEWVEQELARFAEKDGFSVDGNAALVPVPGGHDVRLATTTHRRSETVRALRQVFFRARRTYFVSCYASESAFENARPLFERLLDSVRVDEGEPLDLGLVQRGQSWRWRSAGGPDALVWDVTGKEDRCLRYRATEDGVRAARERTSPSRLDPREALIAAARIAATPRRAGAETLEVSGVRLACDIYEARSEGRTYRIWLTRSFPLAVRLTVDGLVVRELAEIRRSP